MSSPEVEVRLSDAGWRIYYIEARLLRLLRGLEGAPDLKAVLDVARTGYDAIGLALHVFDKEDVEHDPRASERVCTLLRQSHVSDAVRLVEQIEAHPSTTREVADLRRCVTEIDELATFFGEEWPAKLDAPPHGQDVT